MDQNSSPTANAGATTSPTQPHNFHLFKYIIIAILCLIAGGLVSHFMFPAKMSRPDYLPKVSMMQDKVRLPVGAIQIQECADNEGTLYVEPENIPVGPVYMVKDGEVIGIEYMLAKDEFLSGKSYKFLKGMGLKIDHVNISLMSEGHEGYPIPHYRVDIYTVAKEVEQKLICPPSVNSTMSEASSSSEMIMASTSAQKK